jgi:hypothetical protein
MAEIKDCNQIRNKNCIKSFRSCRVMTGSPTQSLDQGRMHMGKAKLAFNNQRAEWVRAAKSTQ